MDPLLPESLPCQAISTAGFSNHTCELATLSAESRTAQDSATASAMDRTLIPTAPKCDTTDWDYYIESAPRHTLIPVSIITGRMGGATANPDRRLFPATLLSIVQIVGSHRLAAASMRCVLL